MFHLPKSFFRAMLLALCTAATPALAATSIEFYNAGIDHYFMTASTDEATSLDNKPSWGWVRTGKTFDVSLTQASAPSNASPVCRFYGIFSNGTVGSHFYTVDQDECAYVKSRLDWGWGYEGDAFYAVKPTGGACPTGTSPVYRVYNNGMGGAPNHRYMTSQAEVDAMVLQGWVSESVAMCASSSTGTGGTTGGTSTYQSAYDTCYNGTPTLYTSTYCAAYANAIVAGSTPAAANLAGAVAAGSNVGNIGMGQPITAIGTPRSTPMSGSMTWTIGNQYSGAQINYKFHDSANNLVWPSWHSVKELRLNNDGVAYCCGTIVCRADERSVIRRMLASCTTSIRRITACGLIRPTTYLRSTIA